MFSLGKTEVCLTLSPATANMTASNTSDTDKLWLKTKHLLLAILPAVQVEECGRKLIGALKSRTTSVQEQTYCDILDKRDIAGDQVNHGSHTVSYHGLLCSGCQDRQARSDQCVL